MPIYQPGGTNAGYRGPAKTLTIKALQDRQAALAAAQEAAASNAAPITNMWQGAGALANSLGDSMQMSRAASQESDARAQLAGIMAQIDPSKGASMEQIAAMQQLDPEFANKEYMRAMEERAAVANREDQQQAATDLQTGQQAFTAGENELSRGATAEQNDLNRQADIAKQKLADANAAGRQDDAQLAAEELARIQAQLTETNDQADATRKVTAIGTETDAKKAEALKLNLKEGTPEYNKLVYDINPQAPSTTYIGSQQPEFSKVSDAEAAKRLGTVSEEGYNAGEFIGQIRILSDLSRDIGTGKAEEFFQPLMQWGASFGIPIEGLGSAEAFKAIVDKLAPQMRKAGSGSSSDFDAKQFLSSLPALGRTPEGNKVISDTFEAVVQNKQAAAEIARKAQRQEISWQDAEARMMALPSPYEIYNKAMAEEKAGGGGGGGGGGGDAGGGGGGAPVYDPKTDAIGDTGTDDDGNNWIVEQTPNGPTWVNKGKQ